MKRTLAFILALIMVLSLCACGKKKPAPGVVEITPDNWYAYFDVVESDPAGTEAGPASDGEDRYEEHFYAFHLKDEYASAILDISDETVAETYDLESLAGAWSNVQFSVSYDTLDGQCNADGDIIPVLAQVDTMTSEAYYSPENASDPYNASFAYSGVSYRNNVPDYANKVVNLTVTDASGQLIMTPEAAEAAAAAEASAQPPVFDTYDPGQTTEVALTMDNWQDYFELTDDVREYNNAFGEVEGVSMEYSVLLKDEYLMKLAPGSNAIFQVTYTQTSPDGYVYESDWDGEVDFSYLNSDSASFGTYVTSVGMQTDEAGQYVTDEAGQYIPSSTVALTMARVAGTLYLYN